MKHKPESLTCGPVGLSFDDDHDDDDQHVSYY